MDFTTDANATPGSTLTSTTSLGLLNQMQADPNHYNDAWIPLSVNIAPAPGAPMVDWRVGGGVAGLVLIAGAGALRGRRRRRVGQSAA